MCATAGPLDDVRHFRDGGGWTEHPCSFSASNPFFERLDIDGAGCDHLHESQWVISHIGDLAPQDIGSTQGTAVPNGAV